MSIEISNESGREVVEEELLDVARFVIARMDVHPAAELSMVLVDSNTMADLHVRWMDLPGPTDVMSFPMDELEPGGRPDAPEPGPSMLGDIVLCPSFAAEQAEKAGHSLDHELALLTVHGMLHLLATTTPNLTKRRKCSACRTSCSPNGTRSCGSPSAMPSWPRAISSCSGRPDSSTIRSCDRVAG